MTALNHGIREIKLPIEFQSARMDRQRARCRSRLSRSVDDARLHVELAEPESKDQAGRAGPYDQNIAARHTVSRLAVGSI